MSDYFLGVDGGQSGTTAVVGDETGRIVGVGRSGPCNHVATEQGRTRFLTSLSGAVAATGVSHFRSACLGFSGGPKDKDSLTREIVKSECYSIVNDAVTALAGALAGEPGVVMIAGTGSIAFGRNASGEEARAGGWGYVFGDEGGAFDLVRRALRAALQYEEGWGPATTLRDALLHAEGADSANDLLHLFYTDRYPRSRVATLAPLVGQCAESGDAVAASILDECTDALATIAKATCAKLGVSRVSYVGGVFQNARILARFRMLVNAQAPLYGPAVGALLEAYRIAGLRVVPVDVPDELRHK